MNTEYARAPVGMNIVECIIRNIKKTRFIHKTATERQCLISGKH